MNKLLLFMLALLIPGHGIMARQAGENKRTPGILVAARSGTSFMVTELQRDFSGTVNEFNNQAGPFAGMEISRFFTSSFEAGAGVSYAFLKGSAARPEFSATGYQYRLEEVPAGPMQYNNRLYGPEVFARYHIGRRLHLPQTLNLFLKAGAGVLFYRSELFYTNRPEEIIFGKRRGEFTNLAVTNVSAILGGGLNYNLSEKISFKLGANLNMVGYDFLDVVHNFHAEGRRREVLGLFTDLTAGITIRLKKQESSVSPAGGRFYVNRHLPFSPE